jgi:hypothetical protein
MANKEDVIPAPLPGEIGINGRLKKMVAQPHRARNSKRDTPFPRKREQILPETGYVR